MLVTKVTIKYVNTNNKTKLLAFVDIEIDDAWAIHEIKLIQNDTAIFMAMPDREIKYLCQNPICKKRSPHSATYCMHCGIKLLAIDLNLHRFQDIVHPIKNEVRQYIHNEIIKAYFASKILLPLAKIF